VATSPTQLTLKWLRDEGYLAEVVKNGFQAQTSVKTSGAGATLLLIRDDETVAVQCTSWDNISSRVRKIAESETICAVRKANWTVWVIGWKKRDNRWVHKLVDCS
jgi:hypothetical protein